jgi:hypothetical protein
VQLACEHKEDFAIDYQLAGAFSFVKVRDFKRHFNTLYSEIVLRVIK